MLFRCPECRTRRKDFKLFTQHLKTTGHALCRCGGYHYSHRPGSPFCETNPLAALRMADRYGATEADLVRCARHIMEATPHAAAQVRDLLKNWGINDGSQVV